MKELTRSQITINSRYQTALDKFKSNLISLGYNKGSIGMLPSCVKDFLIQQEQKGIFNFQNIQSSDIKEYYEHLNIRPNLRRKGALSSVMISHYIYSLRVFFAFLEANKHIKTNPISALTFPRPQSREREVLTVEEIQLLYEASETYIDKALLGIFYGCGLRRTEGVKLDIKDINFRDGLLYVREGKNSKRRVVPMTKRIIEDLKNYLHKERHKYTTQKKRHKNQDAFLLNQIGNRMDGDKCNRRLKELVSLTDNSELMNKEISLHCLRHSIATHLLENGMSLEMVKDFLGHSVLESTMIYTRITDKLKKRL